MDNTNTPAIDLHAGLDPLKKVRANARPESVDLPKIPKQNDLGLFVPRVVGQDDPAQTPKEPKEPKEPKKSIESCNLLRVAKIEAAIQNILDNLANGIEISKYEIDGIRIEKRSPLELINQLEKLKMRLSAKPLPRYVQYRF
ncbi:hypothetical protein NHP200010_09660 [Helicobacter bizzozeronii]|uniref:hypothetical protein n=1 Tax=Helicobacter bizzozeronii TaxID=56877 RepID=UPI00244D84AA|nr:hypothetical protein [Helicobacter bizzozeronii]GMB93252.1 hypothetical protein NHP200010_09660 [Helicobacter bizzozeronii]